MIMMVIMMGCGTKYWVYKGGERPSHVTDVRIIPVWVDSKFSKWEMMKIRGAIKEWNGVFNGQIVLRLDKPYVGLHEAQERGEEINRTGNGWIIMKYNEDDPLIKDYVEIGDKKLAFVPKDSEGHVMVVIGDRIGERDIGPILLHEMGHMLGAKHVNIKGLMYPNEEPMWEVDCIDKVTVMQVAKVQGMEFRSMNYCMVPDLE